MKNKKEYILAALISPAPKACRYTLIIIRNDTKKIKIKMTGKKEKNYEYNNNNSRECEDLERR